MRGAWIGITGAETPQGNLAGRSPCGERGLEYTIGNVTFKSCASLPMRGAWIGIPASPPERGAEPCRSPCGERGLELVVVLMKILGLRRSPCGERGLECEYRCTCGSYGTVAPHAGSVDWNSLFCHRRKAGYVAPHAGSVDWNKNS